MLHAKAVNCCADLVFILDSGPDGGNCPAAGNCRGFNGTCADVMQQFAEVPILPDFPSGLADYTCDAFPMDNKPVDSFIVGLISLAVSLPVVLFLQTAFAVANDSEAPESWLEWYGWRKLVFGFNAHRRWHYTGPAGQPNRHVRWFVRSVGAPPTETAINLMHSAAACATCSEPPWIIEAREAEAENAAGATGYDFPAWDMKPSTGRSCSKKLSHLFSGSVARHGGGDASAPSSGDVARLTHLVQLSSGASDCSDGTDEAMRLARYKRVLSAVGIGGVYVCWAVFSWYAFCSALSSARVDPRSHAPATPAFAHRFVFTYGMLIYRLLGEQAEQEFARSWGVSYGINAAAEWKVSPDAGRGLVVDLFSTKGAFVSTLAGHRDRRCAQHRRSGHPRAALPHPCDVLAGRASGLLLRTGDDIWKRAQLHRPDRQLLAQHAAAGLTEQGQLHGLRRQREPRLLFAIWMRRAHAAPAKATCSATLCCLEWMQLLELHDV